MQATQVRQPFHREPWVYEERIDGWRMLADKDGRTSDAASRAPPAIRHVECPDDSSRVQAAGDLAEPCDVGVGQPGLTPGVLQRHRWKLDVQAAGIAARDVRREHPPAVGHETHERVSKPREVGWSARRSPAT